MPRKSAHRLAPEESHTSRIAWWTAFVATIAVIALLNFVRSAEAAPAPDSTAATLAIPTLLAAADEEEEGEEEEFEETEECEEISETELECFSVEPDERVPTGCRLTSTSATVSVTARGKLRLTLHYVAATPATVAVNGILRGPKGSLNLGTDRRHFAGSGVLRESQALSPAQTTKALAARTALIEVRPLSAPRYCHVYFDQRLDNHRASPRGPARFS